MAETARVTVEHNLQPFLLETSRAGVSAVGEGAMAVQFVHAYLKSM